MSAAVCEVRAWTASAATTRAPACAKHNATPCPIPCPAPVTIATRPSSLVITPPFLIGRGLSRSCSKGQEKSNIFMSTYLQELASRLVSFDTVSIKSNVEAMDYLGSHLDGHGFTTAFHRTEVMGVTKVNLVAYAGPPEPDGLIISGHVDVVPFVGQPGWQRDP